MPVDKQIGRLWFDTQEEIDRYDDLMVSNIELKEVNNSDDPNYTFISPRPRREIMPGLTEKAKREIQSFKNFKPNTTEKHSFRYFYEWPLIKINLGLVGSYLIIRELPIRNFYARSLIMAVYLGLLNDTFKWKGFYRPMDVAFVSNYDYNH